MDIISKTRGRLRLRLQHIYDLCKSKNICQNDDGDDAESLDEKKVNLQNHFLLIYIYTVIVIGISVTHTICMQYE